MILSPGLTACKDAPWVGDFNDSLVANGFSVVVVGYRATGKDASGNELMLKTNKLYSAAAFDDFCEPATYLYDKYCKAK